MSDETSEFSLSWRAHITNGPLRLQYELDEAGYYWLGFYQRENGEELLRYSLSPAQVSELGTSLIQLVALLDHAVEQTHHLK